MHCIALHSFHKLLEYIIYYICKWYERFVCKLYLPNEMRLRHISVNVKWIVIRLEIYLHPLRRIYRLCIDSRIVFSINICIWTLVPYTVTHTSWVLSWKRMPHSSQLWYVLNHTEATISFKTLFEILQPNTWRMRWIYDKTHATEFGTNK